jgi:dihydrofolate synthase/folylpolyglutamate synthase
MDYSSCLEWLFSQLPVYQRDGAANYKIDLDKTWALCDHLGNPENSFKSIHIAGTNGKGSTAYLLAERFQAAGYKTGLYTSPHLKDFRERISINGEMIPETSVIRFVEEHKSQFMDLGLSFFEMTVGMAFDHFRKSEVDIAIVEVGMGGRLDSTNVLRPELSIITNIGMDHMQFLGDTRAKIASEKAGIMKKGIPVLIGETDDVVDNIFRKHAEDVGSPLHFAEEMIEHQELLSYHPLAIYQYKNLRTVLAAIELMQARGWNVEKPTAKDPWQLSGLQGRFQIIGKAPMTIADGGHNEEGIASLFQSVSDIEFEELWLVLGLVNDKDARKVLKLFPENAHYIYCQAEIPRAMPADVLGTLGEEVGRPGMIVQDVKEAVEQARSSAGKHDLVLVGGSFFVVAEALKI